MTPFLMTPFLMDPFLRAECELTAKSGPDFRSGFTLARGWAV